LAFDHISHPAKRAFLAAFAETANVKRAAFAACVSREIHYDWKAQDPEYAEAFARARDIAAEALEDEAVRRARTGVLKPVYQMGQRIGVVRVYSDALLATLLKAWLPHKYKERVEQTHSGSVKHAHTIDLSSLSDEELTLLETLADKAAGPGSAPSGA
jgi:terminase small subunit-like protein